jgi:uncharacterized protein
MPLFPLTYTPGVNRHDSGGRHDASPGLCPPPPQRVTVTSDGLHLAALRYLPAGPPRGGLLVCHGAGSRKENHVLMGEQAAVAGLAALLLDFRGHGESEGVLGPEAWHDVLAAAGELRRSSGAPWVAGRGSSMGATMLLLAARERPGTFGALALLCPADGATLLDGLDRLEREPTEDDPEELLSGRYDATALRPFLERLDLVGAARAMPRVLLAHARDDDAVPFAHTERLAQVLAPPTRFITLAEGGHRGPGRSPEVARATIAWALEHGSSARP